MYIQMMRMWCVLSVVLLSASMCWANSEPILQRLLNGAGSSLAEIFPEADMVCVVGQYRTSRRTLEPYHVDVSFWNNTGVFENEVLLVLVKDSEAISEQKRDTYPRDRHGESFSLWPENTCFQDLDARLEITRGMHKPMYEVFDGKERLLAPSRPYTHVKIVRRKK